METEARENAGINCKSDKQAFTNACFFMKTAVLARLYSKNVV